MAVTEGNDGTETGCVHFVRGRVVEVTDWPIHPSIHPSEEGKSLSEPKTRWLTSCAASQWTWSCSPSDWNPKATRDVRRMFNISCSQQKRRANIRSDTLLIDRLLFCGGGTPEPRKVGPRIHSSMGTIAAIYHQIW